MFGPQFLKMLAAGFTVLLAFLIVVATSAATFALGRYAAVRWAGMSDVEFFRDSIVASSAIVVHLTVDRFLHRAWRITRCLRVGATSLIRRFLTKR